MGTIPAILPRPSTNAQLYKFACQQNGAPTIRYRFSFRVSSAMRKSSVNALFTSRLCENKSPQLYPVTDSSGNTKISHSTDSASFVSAMIRSALYPQSAIRISGVAAPTLINPCFMHALSLYRQILYRINKRPANESVRRPLLTKQLTAFPQPWQLFRLCRGDNTISLSELYHV